MVFPRAFAQPEFQCKGSVDTPEAAPATLLSPIGFSTHGDIGSGGVFTEEVGTFAAANNYSSDRLYRCIRR